MLVGACGIACGACRFYLEGVCPGCSSGRGAKEALEKLREVFGESCFILECAYKRGVEYCIKDCSDFPCKQMLEREYPFSRTFLKCLEELKEKLRKG